MANTPTVSHSGSMLQSVNQVYQCGAGGTGSPVRISAGVGSLVSSWGTGVAVRANAAEKPETSPMTANSQATIQPNVERARVESLRRLTRRSRLTAPAVPSSSRPIVFQMMI